MNTTENPRDAQRVKTNREELTELIGRTVSEDGARLAVDRLWQDCGRRQAERFERLNSSTLANPTLTEF